MKKIAKDTCSRCGKVLFPLSESHCPNCSESIFGLCDDCDKINSENSARCQTCTERSMIMIAGAVNRF